MWNIIRRHNSTMYDCQMSVCFILKPVKLMEKHFDLVVIYSLKDRMFLRKLHTPPPPNQKKKRMAKLSEYMANNEQALYRIVKNG